MFWDNYSRLCAEAGKSVSAVAREAGVSTGAVANWKKGAIPRNSILVKISEVLGVSTEELLTDKKEREMVSRREDFDALMKACVGLPADKVKEACRYLEYLKMQD